MPPQTYLLLFVFLAASCQAQRSTPAPPITEGKEVILLDSLEAAYWVTHDTKDQFFERIGSLDRSIQLRSERTVSHGEYQDFLRRDVRDFSIDEKRYLEGEIQTVYDLCARLSPYLLPDTLRFIKTRGAYYGPSTYYTRENYIVIPENELSRHQPGRMQHVLLHELFHVLSRYHPRFREALYERIGFMQLEWPVVIPSPLRERILLNPDGNDFQWAMRIDGISNDTDGIFEGTDGISKDTDAISNDTDAISNGTDAISTWIIPLLFSRYEKYKPKRPGYFAHMDFQLFALEKDTVEQAYVVQVTSGGESTLGPEYFVEYRKKTRDNTEYLIHPDEILADNFIWAVKGYQNRSHWDRFSTEGQILLQAIVDFLEKWEGD